jgi:hypothetical protein
MCRSKFALALGLVAMLAPTVRAFAAGPSGTVSCSIVDTRPTFGLEFKPPYLSGAPAPRGILSKARMAGPCANGGIIGGKFPITKVEARLAGRLSPGTTCLTLTDTPSVEKLSVKIAWLGIDGNGHLRRVAGSSARVGSVSWDDTAKALVFTTGPLKGGFAGSTSTVTLTLDNPQLQQGVDPCPAYSGIFWGGDGESTVTIP